jgi:uncharacterized membrane protein SirB2
LFQNRYCLYFFDQYWRNRDFFYLKIKTHFHEPLLFFSGILSPTLLLCNLVNN